MLDWIFPPAVRPPVSERGHGGQGLGQKERPQAECLPVQMARGFSLGLH